MFIQCDTKVYNPDTGFYTAWYWSLYRLILEL